MMIPIRRLLVALTCLSSLTLATASHIPSSRNHKHHVKRAQCQPFTSTFPQGSVSDTTATPFVNLGAEGTYEVNDSGLQMRLIKPEGTITTNGRTNNVVGTGACINTTDLYQYARVTMEISAATVGGVCTAGILLSPTLPGRDEIDVEILGGNTTAFQSNIFVRSPTDTHEIYGTFGGIHPVQGSIGDFHNYTIDWSENAITWSIDGNAVRTLIPDQTIVNGSLHYPTHAGHIQLGIWDASLSPGTSHWAGGPINWDEAPNPIVATVRSLTVECPYGN